VKPVRDSVAEALQLWKRIPDVVGDYTTAPPYNTKVAQHTNLATGCTVMKENLFFLLVCCCTCTIAFCMQTCLLIREEVFLHADKSCFYSFWF
jgi:hypothetical protein